MKNIEYACFEGVVPEDRLRDILKLHREILGGDITPEEFQGRLQRKRTLLCLVASSDGTPVGYKIGYERNTDEYFSWLGGVKEGFRRQGIASELLKRQHDRARTLGYKRVLTESENKWRDMIILNLSRGFEIVGTCMDPNGDLKILLAKAL